MNKTIDHIAEEMRSMVETEFCPTRLDELAGRLSHIVNDEQELAAALCYIAKRMLNVPADKPNTAKGVPSHEGG